MKTEIFTFTGEEGGGFASSHYFQTPEGVFVFDAQMLPHEAEDLKLQISDDIPGVPISSIFISSRRAEHHGALSVLADRPDIRIYATKQVKKHLEPGTDVITAGDSRKFKWKELTLQLSDIAARERAGNLVCFIPQKQRLLTGDLVFNKVHPYLGYIDIDSWTRALDLLAGLGPKTVYPGHGPVAGGDILNHLGRYLSHFRTAVARFAKNRNQLDEDMINDVLVLMMDKYPDYKLPKNLIPGIAAEFEVQKRRAA